MKTFNYMLYLQYTVNSRKYPSRLTRETAESGRDGFIESLRATAEALAKYQNKQVGLGFRIYLWLVRVTCYRTIKRAGDGKYTITYNFPFL